MLQPRDGAPPWPLHVLHPGWRRARREAAQLLTDLDGVVVRHPRVPQPKPSRLFRGDYWHRVGEAVARYAARLPGADLLYAHFLCDAGYAGLVAARRLGLPLAAIARGDDVHAYPLRWPDRRAKLAAVLKEADLPLACSHGLARDAEAWATAGLSRPIEVVYDGVDCSLFHPLDNPRERVTSRRNLRLPVDGRLLLAVGKAIPAKGWLELLDAFALLAPTHPEWRLVAAGAPPVDGGLDLTAEAEARGLGPRFVRRGVVAPDTMPHLYRAVDAFVLPSHNEGLSIALLEAMASGLPVVATRVPGTPELLTEGVDGHLVPPRDARALKEALASLLDHPSEAESLGLAARRRAQALGDPRSNAGKLLRLFEETIRRRRD